MRIVRWSQAIGFFVAYFPSSGISGRCDVPLPTVTAIAVTAMDLGDVPSSGGDLAR